MWLGELLAAVGSFNAALVAIRLGWRSVLVGLLAVLLAALAVVIELAPQ